MKICPLCSSEVEEFHKKSHLIPEWMYKGMYNDRHKIVDIRLHENRASKKQKGYYDEIICESCEKESQKYDHYSSLILTDRSPNSSEYKAIKRQLVNSIGGYEIKETLLLHNVDFLKFQKFVFICILRSHFAELKNGKYLLIDKHFNKILNLYQSNQIDDSSYPIMVVKYKNDDGWQKMITLPHVDKKNGHHIIEFSGGGFFFWVFVSSHKKPSYVDTISLKQNGFMCLLQEYVEDCGTFKSVLPSLQKIARENPIK
ncbi:MAG: hypothetical protein MI892_26605 [Desulfobacterales bacterium]|nr:hypothetical protein [Desulfobacterales bacterium]